MNHRLRGESALITGVSAVRDLDVLRECAPARESLQWPDLRGAFGFSPRRLMREPG